MSFPSALQSAVFYILACTPCMNVRHRQRARHKAERDRAEKWRTEVSQPGMYRHPSPFSTNPYWEEEITMGPSLPRKNSSKNPSQGRLTTSSGKDSITASSSAGGSTFVHAEDVAVAASLHSLNPSAGRNSEEPSEKSSEKSSEKPSDDPAAAADATNGKPDDDWNRKRYQREDEELWGQQWSGHRFVDAIVKAGSSAGRLIEAKLGIDKAPASPTEPSGCRNLYVVHHRNPPVNDLHPPVVSSRPAHRDAHRWMLQPPPPAKVMEGKVPVRRTSSSTSKGSLVSPAASDEQQPVLDRALLSRRLEVAARRERNRGGREIKEEEEEEEEEEEDEEDEEDEKDEGEEVVLPSEEKLIEEIIGRPAPRRTLTGRSRSFSVESSDSWDSGPDRWWPAVSRKGRGNICVRDKVTATDKENMPPVRVAPLHAVQRPKLETIMSSRIFNRSALVSAN